MKLNYLLPLACISSLISLYSSTIDYHANHLSFGNFGEKNEEIQRVLETQHPSAFSLNLSDNYIDDSCIETLVTSLSNHKYLDHLIFLDLTNNRITQKGLLMLAPLIVSDSLKYLVIPINSLGIEDIRALSVTLEIDALKKSEEESIDKTALLSSWLSKVIWLPESFDFDRLPIPLPSKEAHKQYYRK